MIRALDLQSTKHAGTAPAKVKYSAAKLLQKLNPDELYPLVIDLSENESFTAQEVGSLCLPDFYGSHAAEVTKLLYSLADSNHWEVREWAAGACGKVLSESYADFSPVVTDWTRDGSDNIRRAAILAIMYAVKADTDRICDHVDSLLHVLEPLLSDESRYVRDNLGPFAIGDGLLKACPKRVTAWLRTWTESEDAQVRWNIAMAFSTAAAGELQTEGRQILDILSADERPTVKRAVAKARRNLAKRSN